MSNVPIPTWLSQLYMLLFALLPWSVEIDFGAWSLTAPAEPLIAITGICLLYVVVKQRQWPLFEGWHWLPVAWIVWMAVGAAVSTMPLVSWKYWVVEAGQWWVFGVGVMLWPDAWPRWSRVLIWSLSGVALYAIAHHGYYQFRADQATLAPMPFFDNRTSFSAVIALVLPIAVATKSFRPGILVLLVALVLAASRAAWLSLLVAAWVGMLIARPKYRMWLGVAALLALGAFVFMRDAIGRRLSADVSSMERLNRYKCALRMAADRPFTGFGPGTYAFQYLPYQQPADMTRISVTAPIEARGPHNYGRGGGAHSEYFQALTELGWPGLLLWFLLIGAALSMGIRRFRQTGQYLCLALTLSLLTFFLHGLVNNFLHDARVAALVWGGVSVVVGRSRWPSS